MKRKVTVLEVRILQDPVPGWGHIAKDHVDWMKDHLQNMIPHYKPEVKFLREEEVET